MVDGSEFAAANPDLTRPGRTRASLSASPTVSTTVATSPLPTSTADGSSENPSWVA
jgi:hypothetical protein